MELIKKKKYARRARARAPRPRGKFSTLFELSINIVADVAPGLGRRVRPLAPPGRVLGQFRPSRTVLPLKKLKMLTFGGRTPIVVPNSPQNGPSGDFL